MACSHDRRGNPQMWMKSSIRAALHWLTSRPSRGSQPSAWRWARPPSRGRDIEKVAILADLVADGGGSERLVDDRSFQDLEIDKVFHRVDRTASSVGSQRLYRELRCSRVGRETADRELLVRWISENPATGRRIGAVLSALDTASSWYLPVLLWDDLPAPPIAPAALRAYSLVLPASIVAGFWLPWIWALSVISFMVNVIASNWLETRIRSFVAPLPDLVTLVGAASRLDDSIPIDLRSALNRVPGRLHRSAFLIRLTSNRFLDTTGVLEYINILTLLRLRSFFSLRADLLRSRDALQEVLARVGELDVALSIASLRAESDSWNVAATGKGESLRVEGACHPLLRAAVPSSMELDGRGLLLTGLNMSGKSTFVKALGVNALLAQTLNTVLAESWVGPEMRIRTSFGAKDDIESGASLFLGEAKRALEIFEERDGGLCLFLLDEAFRGTGVVERIAATAEVLLRLHEAGHFVVAVSHALELADQTAGSYSVGHLRCRVEDNRLVFDYVLVAGLPGMPTSLKLMRGLGFPNDFLEGVANRAGVLAGGAQPANAAGFPQSPAKAISARGLRERGPSSRSRRPSGNDSGSPK